LLAISVLLGIHNGSFACPYGHQLRNYYIGAIVLLSVGIIHTAVTMLISMRGSIRDSHSRRHMNILLYLKFAILVPEAIWIIIATYWAFGFAYTCDRSVYWAARGAVICAWIVGFWMFVGILLVFDPLGSAEHRMKFGDTMAKKGSEYAITTNKPKNIVVWEQRCRCLCCCIAKGQDTDEAFSDVSKLVADFFKDIDLVPTDIAAGLMLVEQEQKLVTGDLSAVIVDAVPAGHADTTHAEAGVADVLPSVMTGGDRICMTVPQMAHYMNFALGSYGWPFFMYTHFTTGLFQLCAACRCCSCMRQDNQVYADNICQCHTAAIKRLTRIPDQDLIYISFHNKYREIPFYVAVDREFSSVVVSIRGTLSLQDALTDLSARGVPLHIDGVPDATCHDAMLDCAQYIRTQLEKKQLLEQAFSFLPEGSQLVIVGHSLGAGVAAILAVLLRPQYSNLTCFAYSPPGGLMSPSASRYTRDFVCSVIVGEDIIPRLGMPSMCDLKVKVLRALSESHMPKYKILATGCFRMLCSCVITSTETAQDHGEVAPLNRQRHRRYSVNNPLEEALKTAEEYQKEMVQSAWPMHPPGRILHIVEMEESRFCGEPQYTAVWAQPEDFASIIISRKMVLDHFPDVVLRALTQLNNRNFVPQACRVNSEACSSNRC
ncbi:hypothetical protein BaRGS_00002403, partial [Batillaria attramentaria]